MYSLLQIDFCQLCPHVNGVERDLDPRRAVRSLESPSAVHVWRVLDVIVDRIGQGPMAGHCDNLIATRQALKSKTEILTLKAA